MAFSIRQTAAKLGIGVTTLAHYVEQGKVPAPKKIRWGGFQVHVWTETEIEKIRKLLPKIANGRKTRYQKKQSAVSNQKKHSAISTQQSVKRRKRKKPEK